MLRAFADTNGYHIDSRAAEMRLGAKKMGDDSFNRNHTPSRVYDRTTPGRPLLRNATRSKKSPAVKRNHMINSRVGRSRQNYHTAYLIDRVIRPPPYGWVDRGVTRHATRSQIRSHHAGRITTRCLFCKNVPENGWMGRTENDEPLLRLSSEEKAATKQ